MRIRQRRLERCPRIVPLALERKLATDILIELPPALHRRLLRSRDVKHLIPQLRSLAGGDAEQLVHRGDRVEGFLVALVPALNRENGRARFALDLGNFLRRANRWRAASFRRPMVFTRLALAPEIVPARRAFHPTVHFKRRAYQIQVKPVAVGVHRARRVKLALVKPKPSVVIGKPLPQIRGPPFRIRLVLTTLLSPASQLVVLVQALAV